MMKNILIIALCFIAFSVEAQDSLMTSKGVKRDTTSLFAPYKAAIQTNITNIATKANSTNIYGTIYNKNTWTAGDLTADFVNTGTDATIVGGKILVTNGASTYVKTLNLKDTSALEYWKLVYKIKLGTFTGTSSGISIGTYSTNSASNASIITGSAWYNGAGDGKQWFRQYYSGTWNVTNLTSTSVAAVAGDYIIMSMERIKEVIRMQCYNYSNAGILLDYSYTYSTANPPILPNTAVHGAYFFGGSFTIDSISLTSTVPKFAQLALVGNSKAVGYATSNFNKSFGAIIGTKTTVAVFGGGNDYSSDIKKRISEVIAGNHKNVLLCDLTSNDQRYNGLADSVNYYANVIYIDSALRANGANVYISVLYEGSINQTNTDLWARRTFGSRYIDTYSTLKPPGRLSGDNVHPSDQGHDAIASDILRQIPVNYYNPYFKNAAPTLQDVTTAGNTTSNFLQITGVANVPTTGAGAEMYYSAGRAYFGGYDRAANAKPVIVGAGSTVNIGVNAIANSTLQTTSFSTAYIAQTSAYTATISDYTIDCNGTFIITLPTSVGIVGRIYIIKNSGAGTITMAGTSAQTFDGITSPTIAAGAVAQYQSNNATWIKVN